MTFLNLHLVCYFLLYNIKYVENCWIATNGKECKKYINRGIQAGNDPKDGSDVYIGRVTYEREILPCKIIPSRGEAFVCYGGNENIIDKFEMYINTAPSSGWVISENGSVPPEAVQMGENAKGEMLFLGRVYHNGSWIAGKIQRSHKCCYIPYEGQELKFSKYEVLVHIY